MQVQIGGGIQPVHTGVAQHTFVHMHDVHVMHLTFIMWALLPSPSSSSSSTDDGDCKVPAHYLYRPKLQTSPSRVFDF